MTITITTTTIHTNLVLTFAVIVVIGHLWLMLAGPPDFGKFRPICLVPKILKSKKTFRDTQAQTCFYLLKPRTWRNGVMGETTDDNWRPVTSMAVYRLA